MGWPRSLLADRRDLRTVSRALEEDRSLPSWARIRTKRLFIHNLRRGERALPIFHRCRGIPDCYVTVSAISPHCCNVHLGRGAICIFSRRDHRPGLIPTFGLVASPPTLMKSCLAAPGPLTVHPAKRHVAASAHRQ